MNLYEAQKTVEETLSNLTRLQREARDNARIVLPRTFGPSTQTVSLSDLPEGPREEFFHHLKTFEILDGRITRLREVWKEITEFLVPPQPGIKITIQVTKECPLSVPQKFLSRLTELLTLE